MDVDLRRLRYFAAVAHHLSFSRAAEELLVSQPALTRQVQVLERELGCALLTRSSRSVALTPAGQHLVHETQLLLGSAAAAVRRVQATARAERRFTVAFVPGIRVAPLVRACAAEHTAVAVDLLRLEWWEKDAALRDGRADLAVLRTPFDHDGLHVVPLGSEPKLLCLPEGHALARRARLTVADLAGLPVLDATGGRATTSVEEKMELVASGQVVALVPESVISANPRDDVVVRTVQGVPAVQVCLAVRADLHVPGLADLVQIARSTMTLRRRVLPR